MPKHIIYKGPAQNIGRFGWVEPGTGLILTDREAESVSKDKRFATNKDPEVPSKSSPAVERENDHEKVVALELREKTKAELLAFVEDLRKEGQTINVSKNPTVAELIRVIESSRPMTDQ
jgi:hypothetical protein